MSPSCPQKAGCTCTIQKRRFTLKGAYLLKMHMRVIKYGSLSVASNREVKVSLCCGWRASGSPPLLVLAFQRFPHSKLTCFFLHHLATRFQGQYERKVSFFLGGGRFIFPSTTTGKLTLKQFQYVTRLSFIPAVRRTLRRRQRVKVPQRCALLAMNRSQEQD